MSKRVWCGMYVASVALLIAALVVAAIIGMLASDEILEPGAFVGAVSVLVLGYAQFVVVHTVSTLVLLFKMWKALEDGVTPVTAGKAVGFLFIPVFNIYWFFRVWGGFPGEYNKFVERNRLGAPQIGSGIFVGFAVTVGLTAVLLIPILILPFVTVFLIARGCDAITNLELSKSAAAAHTVLSPAAFIGTPENPRSKTPVLALAGFGAIIFVCILGFSVFAWFNLHPKPSADVLPAAVGSFTLEQPGRVDGSFFGGTFGTLDNFYVSEVGGSRRALRYNFLQLPSEAKAGNRIASLCGPNASPTVLTSPDGKEAGHTCIVDGSVWMHIGRYMLWAHEPAGYDLQKLKAKGAPLDGIVAFVRALPLAKNIVFPDLNVPASTSTSTASSTSTNVVLSKTSAADFVVSGKEFYDATNNSSAAAKAKYKGKTVEISSRVTLVSENNLMMEAGGYSSLFAYFDTADASAFSSLKREDRVTLKCVADVEYSVQLNHCILVENKGIISATDMPDVTFTAEEYWNTVAGTNLPVDAKIKKQNELKGKIIKITGKVKDLAGTKSYLRAGNDNEFACYADDDNKEMFSSLTDGQAVTFLAVGGSSLSHCIVMPN